MSNIATLPDVVTDRDRAAVIRKEISEKLLPLASIMTEAMRDGFKIDFSLTSDQFGRFHVPFIGVSKIL